MTKIRVDDEFAKRVFECSPLPMVVMDAHTHRYVDCNLAAAKVYGYGEVDEIIGKGPLDFSAPVQYDGTPSSEKVSYYIEKAMQDGPLVFEWRHLRQDGEWWDAEVHLHCFEISEIKLLQFSLLDITERKRTERLQRLVHDLVLELNSCCDLNEGFHQVLKTMLRIEPLDCGGIYIADPEDGALHLASHHGLSAKFIAEVSHYDADSSSVRLAQSGTPRYGTYDEIRPSNDPIRENEKLRAFALIPIMADGELIALLNLASHRQDTVPPSSRTILETIAFQIGGSLLRLRSQFALSESEEILVSFMNHSPILAYIKLVTPTDSVVLQASDSFVELIGQGGKDIVGKSMHELFPPEFAQKIIADDQAVIAGDTPVRLEEEFNGNFFNTIKFPVRHGNRTLLCGYTIDVTERKQIESTLSQSEEKYRTLYSTMTQGVVYQNTKGQIISANPAAERILGLTQDQMQGRTSMDPVWKTVKEDGSDFPGEDHPLRVALRTGKEVRNVVHGIYNPTKDSTI